MEQLLYQIFFINGKGISFYADGVQEFGDDFTFVLDGTTVAQFEKKNIAGYVIARVNYHEND